MAATSYVVGVFDKQHWRTILTTGDKGEAEALEQAMIQDRVKVRVEEIMPKVKKRSRCGQVSTAGKSDLGGEITVFSCSVQTSPAYVRSQCAPLPCSHRI